jgi:hypothetical protein
MWVIESFTGGLRQIQARSQIDYRPQGVHVQCTVPLPAEAPAAPKNGAPAEADAAKRR